MPVSTSELLGFQDARKGSLKHNSAQSTQARNDSVKREEISLGVQSKYDEGIGGTYPRSLTSRDNAKAWVWLLRGLRGLLC